MQLPIGEEGDFIGVVDLIAMTAVVWDGEELGAKFEKIALDDGDAKDAKWRNIPGFDQTLYDKVLVYREKLIEQAVDQDEDALLSYLDGATPSNDILKECIRKGTYLFVN